MNNQSTRPFIMYRIMYRNDLARLLQKPPYGWHCAWKIIEIFEESISSFWSNNAPLDALAETIHILYMESTRPRPFSLPTKESMAAVGCTYTDAAESI